MKLPFKYVAGGVVCLAMAFGVGGCIVNSPYSQGYRDGSVQKFSVKGLIRKSWEGDMALAGSARSSQALGNVWHFTVSDPQVIKDIEKIPAGHPVRLHYIEWWWTFNGETNYRVTKVEPIDQ
jgi:hypothetical protein